MSNQTPVTYKVSNQKTGESILIKAKSATQARRIAEHAGDFQFRYTMAKRVIKQTAEQRAAVHIEEIEETLQMIKDRVFVLAEQSHYDWSDVSVLASVNTKLEEIAAFINA